MARTTVVTVTYNSEATIAHMLEALRAARAAGKIEIVVVDNASSDETLASLAPYEDGGLVRVLSAGGNIGFGRACNLGASAATTEFVLFLNPDARLEAEDLARLEAVLDAHASAAVAAPVIELPDGSIQPVGAMPSWLGLALDRTPLHPIAHRTLRVPRDAEPIETTWVSGAAFLIRRAAFEAVGGFDPRFFLYYEESDLFRRLSRKKHQILACGNTRCTHIGGHSASTVQAGRISGAIANHFIRSRNHYARKNFGTLAMAAADLAFAATLMVRATLVRSPADRAAWRARRGVPMLALPAHPPTDPAQSTAGPSARRDRQGSRGASAALLANQRRETHHAA